MCTVEAVSIKSQHTESICIKIRIVKACMLARITLNLIASRISNQAKRWTKTSKGSSKETMARSSSSKEISSILIPHTHYIRSIRLLSKDRACFMIKQGAS